MNERIWELAKQAQSDDMPYDSNIPAEFIVRLSELIVQECAELTLDYKSDQYYNGWIDYRDEIKKHFGVEE